MKQLESEYRKTFRACSYDEDTAGCLQPGALLRFGQEISIDQCSKAGLDADFYRRTHTTFLLARQTLVLEAPAPVNRDYILETHPCGMQRASYRRFTRVLDGAGQTVARLDTVWMLIDTDTKRILRREPESYGEVRWPEAVNCPPLDLRLEKPAEAESCGEVVAGYTLCDENGHINNTRYADLFLDALPPDEFRRGRVKRMTLHYHREIPFGRHFVLRRGLVRQGLWYLSCEADGLCCAEGIVELGQ